MRGASSDPSGRFFAEAMKIFGLSLMCGPSHPLFCGGESDESPTAVANPMP
jgi:hypothetical protein